MRNLVSNKSIEGSPDISINSSCLLPIALQFKTGPDTSNLQGWILWPKAQHLGGFKTNPSPRPSLEMGQLQPLRKQAHPV